MITFPKLNYRLIMGWLFLLSLAAVPASWFFFNVQALLWSIAFFAAMFAYQVIETLYDERKTKKRVDSAITISRQIDAISRLEIAENVVAYYHNGTLVFPSETTRMNAEYYLAGSHYFPTLKWVVDAKLYHQLKRNVNAA